MSNQIKLIVTRSNVSGRKKLVISVKNIGMNNLDDVEVKWTAGEYYGWRTKTIKLRPLQTEEIPDANWYSDNYQVELYVDGKLIVSERK